MEWENENDTEKSDEIFYTWKNGTRKPWEEIRIKIRKQN